MATLSHMEPRSATDPSVDPFVGFEETCEKHTEDDQRDDDQRRRRHRGEDRDEHHRDHALARQRGSPTSVTEVTGSP